MFIIVSAHDSETGVFVRSSTMSSPPSSVFPTSEIVHGMYPSKKTREPALGGLQHAGPIGNGIAICGPPQADPPKFRWNAMFFFDLGGGE
jgi:hypothetical protein